jgi:hypothetical protein
MIKKKGLKFTKPVARIVEAFPFKPSLSNHIVVVMNK